MEKNVGNGEIVKSMPRKSLKRKKKKLKEKTYNDKMIAFKPQDHPFDLSSC